MKKLILSIAFAAGLLGAVSCDVLGGGLMVDWTPVDITIEAYDSEGNSIVSEDMPGMTLTFKGEEYTVKPWDYWDHPQSETKAYLAIMAGLRAKPIKNEQGVVTQYVLNFGEIDGAKDMDEDIVLNWPDGSTDTIHYHCSNHREWPTIDCTRKWKLNGKKHDGSTFVFRGKSLK